MIDFLKKISVLAVELDSKNGFDAIMIIDEMKRLYESHFNKICSDLKSELEVTESLLKERERVLNAIPECELHGKQCVPHAIEWIEEMKESVGQKKKINE